MKPRRVGGLLLLAGLIAMGLLAGCDQLVVPRAAAETPVRAPTVEIAEPQATSTVVSAPPPPTVTSPPTKTATPSPTILATPPPPSATATATSAPTMTATTSPTAAPSPKPAGPPRSLIAFRGASGAYYMDLDSHEPPQPLAAPVGVDRVIHWFEVSPTGREAAVKYADYECPLFVAELGGQPHHLADNVYTFHWSPDGQWLAYLTLRPGSPPWMGSTGIFVARPDGTERRQVLPGQPGQRLEGWTPDGKELVVFRESQPGPESGLGGLKGDTYLVPAAGGAPQLLAEGFDFRIWSPDGQLAVMETATGDHGHELYLLSRDGRQRTSIGPGAVAYSPRIWLPDSSGFVMISEDKVWLVSARDGSRRVLAENATYFGGSTPVLTADGARVLFVRLELLADLRVIGLDGTGERVVGGDPDTSTLQVFSSVYQPAAAPTATPTLPTPTPLPPPMARAPSYIYREVIVARAGSGPGEVGIGAVEGNRSDLGRSIYSPSSLAVDRAGSIYILDNVNRRVNAYSPQGVFLRSIPYRRDVEAGDLAVDGVGRLYILDLRGWGSVRQYDPAGNIIKVYTHTEPGALHSVRVDEAGNILVHDGVRVFAIGNGEREFTMDERLASEMKGIGFRGGAYWLEERDGTGVAYHLAFSDGREIALPFALPAFRSGIAFLDLDRDGNIYALRLGHSSTPLVVYDAWARALTVLSGGGRPGLSPGTRYLVHDAGDIYYLWSSNRDATVVKWQRQ